MHFQSATPSHPERAWWRFRALGALILLLGGLRQAVAVADVRQLALPTNDLVYDRFTRRLYASVPAPVAPSLGLPGDSVVVIDPEAGTMGPAIPVGSPPGKLALSDDGRYLYVALDQRGMVRRLDLPSLSVGMEFSVGAGSLGPNQVDDMKVMPGHPETLAVSRARPQGGGHNGIAIYDNGVARPDRTPSYNTSGSVLLQFSASPSRLYAYSYWLYAIGFRRLEVGPSGVQVLEPGLSPDAYLGQEMVFDAGRAYFNQGKVIDPESLALLGTYAPIPRGGYYDPLVLPDSEVGRVFFLGGDEREREIRAFEQQSFLLLGSLAVPGVPGRARRLLRWGADGLAFSTDQSRVVLVRTSLIPAEDLVFSFRPASVRGGREAVGRLDLRRPAPPEGLTIPLASSSSTVTVPTDVMVRGSATTATFRIRTAPVPGTTPVGVYADYEGRRWQTTLTVLPDIQVTLGLAARGVTGSQLTTGMLTLSRPAPAGGLPVALSADPPGIVTLPEQVVVPAGAMGAPFPVTTRYVSTPTTVMLAATYAEAQSAVPLGVLPPTVAVLALEPTAIIGGEPVTGRLRLIVPAPPEGTVVMLASGRPDRIATPTQVALPAGAADASFVVTTTPVDQTTPVTVAATAGGQTILAALMLYPRVARVQQLELTPNPVLRGLAATGIVTLEAPAPARGVVVTLTSSMPGVVRVPASVRVEAGAATARFSITTARVRATTMVTLTATAEGGAQEASLTVLLAGISVVRLSAGSVVGGQNVTGTVTLATPAPAGGVVVPLTTDRPASVVLPAAVTVPAGARSAAFLVQTRMVSGPVAATITATYAGEARSVRLNLRRR
jgi:hypothetical protein